MRWWVQIEVIRANVVGTLTLADVTNERGIHLCIYATGCIFHYDKDFPQDSGKGFTEEDTPNFTGSYYSKTKVRKYSAASTLSQKLTSTTIVLSTLSQKPQATIQWGLGSAKIRSPKRDPVFGCSFGVVFLHSSFLSQGAAMLTMRVFILSLQT
jgi:hypothetical protein